jgi:hypothetical protein
MDREKARLGWVAVVCWYLLHKLEVLHSTYSVTDCDLDPTFVSQDKGCGGSQQGQSRSRLK